MTLPKNVKSEPYWFRYLPRANGRTILSTVYIKKEIFDDLHTKYPKPQSVAVLAHEQTHLDRISEKGKLTYSLMYILSGQFRFNEELEANKQAFKILKKNKVKIDIDRKAEVLSSWRYIWPVSYQFAKKELERAWELA